MKKSEKIVLGLLFGLVLLVSLVPIFHLKYSVGSEWKGIVPEYIEDSLYYYSRVNDVVRGNPLIGNPYFIEHKDEVAPAFLVSDWLASVPFLAGFPFNFGIFFNILLWSEVFVFIIYFVFRRLEIEVVPSAVFSFLTYLQVFWLFVRPVIMQVVFPAYILFLLTLFIWLKDGDSRKNFWLLLLSTLYAVYSYTYLLQIVLVTYGLLFLLYLVEKRWVELKSLSKLLLGVVIGSIPLVLFTLDQVSSPLYSETINRIGFTLTHVPRMDLFFYGRWVVLAFFLWLLAYKWLRVEKNTFIFWGVTGAALLVAAGSNIITGRELELANHVGRFIIVWFSLVFLTWLYYFWRHIFFTGEKMSLYKRVLLGILISIGFLGIARNIPRAFPFFRMSHEAVIALQDYRGPIEWLKNSSVESKVVLAPDSFSGYVPMMTNHYVAFHPSGALNMVSDRELEDRYLVSRFFFGGVTRNGIENDVKLYGGAGKALKGGEMQKVFDEMYARYNEDIEPNISTWLAKFKVKFIVINLTDPYQISQLKKVSTVEAYRDSNIAIFEVLP